MPKRSSKREDANQSAFRTLMEATGEKPKTPAKPEPAKPDPTKNPAAVALGRLGGLKGGKARAASMSEEQRSNIAKQAAKARWKQRQG
ncbi:MAG TPA: hypothetical protein VHN77_08220 [Phycisphaerales bacterium]|nr:hypothetical protein [Phycisphaerales bacterium]